MVAITKAFPNLTSYRKMILSTFAYFLFNTISKIIRLSDYWIRCFLYSIVQQGNFYYLALSIFFIMYLKSQKEKRVFFFSARVCVVGKHWLHYIVPVIQDRSPKIWISISGRKSPKIIIVIALFLSCQALKWQTRFFIGPFLICFPSLSMGLFLFVSWKISFILN